MRFAVAGAIVVVFLAGKVTSKPCDNGVSCTPPKECCPQGCCYQPGQGQGPPHGHHGQHPSPPRHMETGLSLSAAFWNHWYLWSLVALLVLSCSGGCSVYRRRHELDLLLCGPRDDRDTGSERDSTASCYPPPQYSRCNSFTQPPPYSEVTSKPDLYPLVISYNDNSGKAGNYLMVHYLRQYFLRPPGGSLSAATTGDSLSSNFVCVPAEADESNGANVLASARAVAGTGSATCDSGALLESTPPVFLPNSASIGSVCSIASNRSADTSVPQSQSQSYSLALGGWSESPEPRRCRPTSLSQHYISGAACSTTVSEVSSLLGMGSPASPPRATSPTGPEMGDELRELLDKIHTLPRDPSPLVPLPPRLASFARAGRARRGWLASRSAPTTPLDAPSPSNGADMTRTLVEVPLHPPRRMLSSMTTPLLHPSQDEAEL